MKKYFALLFLAFYSFVCVSQETAEIEVKTTISEDLSICNGTINVSVSIKNNKEVTIYNPVLYTGLPDGVFYIPGSVSGMQEPILSENLDISNPYFEAITDSIKSGDTLIVSYYVRGNCELLSYLEEHFSVPGEGYVKHDTKLSYTENGIQKEYIEPSGSDSYNVLSPDIELYVNQEDIDVSNYLTTRPFFRHISVTNSGQGATDKITFAISKDDVLDITTLYLTNGTNGTNGEQEANGMIREDITIATLQPVYESSVELRYEITDFSAFDTNNDGLFSPGESITLMDEAYVTAGCAQQSYATQYHAMWGCDEVNCNEEDNEAKFSVYINIPKGASSIGNSLQMIQKTDFCDTHLIYTIDYYNNGSGHADPVQDAAIDFYYYTRKYDIKSIHLIDENGVELADLMPYIDESNSTYTYFMNSIKPTSNLDGEGIGLEDVDADGQYDDIPVGNHVRIKIEMKPPVNTYVYNYSRYHDFCGTNRSTSASVHLYYSYGGASISGTTYVYDSDTLVHNISLSGSFRTYGYSTVSGVTYSGRIIMDSGMQVIKLEGNIDGTYQEVSYNQSGDTLNFDRTATSYRLTTVYTCSTTDASQSLRAYSYANWTTSCFDKPFSLGSRSFTFYPLCGGGPGWDSTAFSMERTFYGIESKGSGVNYHYNEFYGPDARTPITRETCEKPNYGLPDDRVEATIKGNIAQGYGANINELVFRLNYVPVYSNREIFRYENSTLYLGNNIVNIDSVNFLSEYVDGLYMLKITVPLNGRMVNDAEEVKLVANFRINANSGYSRYTRSISNLTSNINAVTSSGSEFSSSYVRTGFSFNGAYLYNSLNSVTYEPGKLLSPYHRFYRYYYSSLGNEYRGSLYMKKITASLPAGFKFTQNITQKGYYNPVEVFSDAQTEFSEDSTQITVTLDEARLMDMNRLYTYFKIALDEDNFTPPSLGNYTYYRWYLTIDYVDNAHLPLEEHTIKTTNRTAYIYYRLNRNLILTTNDIQEGFSDHVKWPVQLGVNGNAGHTQNTYIAVELKPEDNSTVLMGIEDDAGNAIPVTFYGPDNINGPEGNKRYMLANIGTVLNYRTRNFKVVARYVNCVDDRLQDIDIYAGWKYYNPIDVTDRDSTILTEETKLFPIQKDELSIRYKTADMQWQINKQGEEAGNLCEPHIYDIDILSTKYADMHDIKLDVIMPQGVSINDAALTYQYPAGNEFATLPTNAYSVLNDSLIIHVDSLTGWGYLPGTRMIENDIRIRTEFSADCTIDPGIPIDFQLHGITNCDDTIVYRDQRKIILEDFDLDELEIVANASDFSYFRTNTYIDIQISNVGEETSSEQELIIELPDGVDFSSVVSTDLIIEPEVLVNSGQTSLKWQLPEAYIGSGMDKSLTIEVERTTNSLASFTVDVSTQMPGEVTCITDNSTCNLTATTGSVELLIINAGSGAGVTITPETELPSCEASSLRLLTKVSGAGTASLTYTWQKNGIQINSGTENFLEIPNFTVDALGTYSVTISDGSGKSLTGTLELQAEDIIPIHSITITGQTPTTCANSTDGEVRFMINDPTGDMYTYQIIDGLHNVIHSDSVAGAAEAVFTQLPTGVFTLEATSPNGCISSTTFTINSGSPVLQIVCTSSLPCDIQDGEQIDLSFDFVLNRPRPLASTSEFAFRVKDGNGNIMVMADTLAFYDEVTDVTFPYTHGQEYFLQYVELGGPCGGTGESAEFPLNFTPVNYHIVLNGEGNVFERCYEELPDNIVADLVLGRSSCSPEITGTYTVNLFRLDEETGDHIAVSCSWCDGSNQIIFPTTMAVGEYVIESSISDLFYGNCSATASFIIPEPSALEVEITTYDVTCAGGWDGGASANVKGGFPNYEYYWYYGNELLSRDAEVTGLPAGSYFLKVQDSRGCEMLEQYNFTINDGDVMDAITVDLPTSTGTTCDVSASITGVEPGETYTFRWVRVVEEVKDSWLRMFAGDSIDSYENVSFTDAIYVEDGETTATSLSNLNQVPPGNYYITVTNSKGCQQSTLLQNLPAFNGHQLGELFEISGVEVEREYNMCFNWKTHTIEVDPDTVAVNNNNLLASITATEIAYDLMDAALECGAIAGKRAEASFEDICLNADSLKDELTIEYDVEYYHFTLYYFDRAGNLVKTVPPAGVNPLTGDQVSRMNYPDHTLLTEYNYNSLGQVVTQTTPDAGTTRFIYNNAGQLRFSQNAKQADESTFSYSKYDAQGRVIETGQAVLNGSSYTGGGITVSAGAFNDLQQLVPVDAVSFALLPAEERFPVAAQAPTEQTFTYYSTPTAGITCNGQTQRHLLNRVSYTLHYNSNSADPAATYYSYDPHGNVEWMVQYIDGVKPKTIAYEYDLISGNVREVAYNKGEPDQFFHRYQYDEDNRIIVAETSPNGVIWERDARYEYYAHGPLKRTELGEDKVQGLDYVYTLQGWLKAINHPGLDPTLDPGSDGTNTGRDVFGMVLSYFDGDFVNSNPASINLAAETKPETGRSLYNGNIAAWTHATARTPGNLDYSHLNGQQFTYDVLNRIKSSKFENRGTEYQSTYSYDPNGNLLALNRNAAGTTETEQEMDRLTYQYYDNTNRLKQVADAVDATKFTSDVDNQTSTENYTYDEIGNLTADEAEGIASINWTVAGKVSSITKTDGTLIRFDYDAMGNRVKKELTTIGGLVTATYYVRDASGNIMATYNETEEEIDGGIDKIAGLAEQPIYGSSRLGMQLGDANLELQRRRVINGVAPYYIGDANTMYHGHSHSWALIADNEATANLLTVDMSSTQPGTPQKTLYPMGPANFAPVTMAADTTGNHLFTFAVADSLNGQANVALVYDYRGLLMKETDGERPMALSKGAAITVKKPGSESNWLIITTAEEGKLLAHTVNTDSTGYGTINEPAGEIISKNRLLATGPFLNAMAVLADHTGGTEKLLVYLLRRESSTQVSLQTWLVDENLATRMLHKTPLFSLNTWLPATIAMAGDGKHLAVVMGKGYTAPLYGLAQDGAQIRYYSINDYSRTPELVKTEPIEGELLVNSAEWDADHVTLCYATMDVFNAYKLHRSNAFGQSRYTYTDVLPKPASLARGASHRVYANALGLNNLYLLDGENLTASAIGLPGTVVNGTMPYQHQLIFDKEKEEQLLYARTLGNKIYEITDHLGNVRATISDRLTLNNGVYEADLLSSSTYYPFGMTIGTLSDESDYRFGFNGKEKDQDGEFGLTAYDYGFRIYNPGIAKFLSVDPLAKEYPWNGTYAFAENDVVRCIDLEGAERYVKIYDYKNQKYSLLQTVDYSKTSLGHAIMGNGTLTVRKRRNEITAQYFAVPGDERESYSFTIPPERWKGPAASDPRYVIKLDKPTLEWESKIKVGPYQEAKLRIGGIGFEEKIGVSQSFYQTKINSNGVDTRVWGDNEAEFGIGAVSSGIEMKTNILWGDNIGKLQVDAKGGPLTLESNFDFNTRKYDLLGTKTTIFDIGIGAFVGGGFSLKVNNENSLSNAIGQNPLSDFLKDDANDNK